MLFRFQAYAVLVSRGAAVVASGELGGEFAACRYITAATTVRGMADAGHLPALATLDQLDSVIS